MSVETTIYGVSLKMNDKSRYGKLENKQTKRFMQSRKKFESRAGKALY